MGPGFLQALKEQLGLKLVPSKGPVEVLVIDHIERPSLDDAQTSAPPAASSNVIPAPHPSLTPVALVQTSPATQPAAAPPTAKPLAFDVVSIRQNISGGAQKFGPTADGFHMTNMPLGVAILASYSPEKGGAAYFTNNQTQGLPDWAMKDRYDIDAKVSEADLPQWQKPAAQTAMLQAMLRAMLEGRCKLVVHRDAKEVPVYELTVGQNGPKFKDTDPAKPPPAGQALPLGGVVVPENGGQTLHFYGAAIKTLAPLLSNYAGRPVQDNTGLTGKYDFALEKPAPPGPPPAATQDGTAAPDPGPSIFSAIEDLGLKLVPAKQSVETLVIDHIEPPSEN